MATPIVLTNSVIEKSRIYITSECTTFCHVTAFSMDDFKLKDALATLKKYAATNKIKLTGVVGAKKKIEALLLVLPEAINERQALFDQLSAGWTEKLAAGLNCGCASDDAYNALGLLQGRIEQTTYRSTLIGQAMSLMARLNDGLLVRPGSTIYL